MNWKEHMNSEKAAVLVDSGCDIAQECIDQYGLWLLPLHIDYPEKAYLDGVDIDPQMVYDRYPKDYPKTSTPSLQEVLDKLEEMADAGIEKVIAVCISSVACGLLGIWAARKLSEGMSYDDVCQGLQDKIYDSKVMFYMDTLEYLKRGGRIGTVSSIIGQALKIKPIISCNKDGIYYTVSLIRGSKQGKKKLLSEMLKFCRGHKVWLGLGHGAAAHELEEMEKMVMDELGENGEVLYRKQIAATLALNTGPGLVGVAAILDP